MERDGLKAKVYIGIDNPGGFRLVPKVIGPQGQFMKFITQKTDCRACVKGIGSNFSNSASSEAQDKLHIEIIGRSSPVKVDKAVTLAKSIIHAVRKEHREYVGRGAPSGGGRSGPRGRTINAPEYNQWKDYFERYFVAYGQYMRWMATKRLDRLRKMREGGPGRSEDE